MAICEEEGGDGSDNKPITLELVCELVALSTHKKNQVDIMKASES